MRGVIAHPPESNPRDLRQILLGSGLDCEAADIVNWQQLPTRLGQQDADVVVAMMNGAADSDWRHIRQAKQLTTAPLVVVGPCDNPRFQQQADRVGAIGVVDAQQIRVGLDEVVEQVTEQQGHERGVVVSVFAPAVGSGGTTVAANLAAAMAFQHPGEIGLLELAAEFGDLALMMEVQPTHNAEQVCQRWEVLDPISLRGSLQPHRSGLRVLVNSPDRPKNEHLSVDSVRRLAVLSRMALKTAVLALDSRLGPCELEAMQLSDRIALVVRPDVVAVKRAHWALTEAVERGVPHERFELVLNRYNQAGALPKREIESALNLPVMHRIPDDPRAMNRAANRGDLVRERNPLRRVSRRFIQMARAIDQAAY